jgi:hypothetical protein
LQQYLQQSIPWCSWALAICIMGWFAVAAGFWAARAAAAINVIMSKSPEFE